MTSPINNACMQKVIESRYQAVWIIRGNLSEILITYLHLLQATLYRRLLPVLPCLRRRLAASRHPHRPTLTCYRRPRAVRLPYHLIKDTVIFMF